MSDPGRALVGMLITVAALVPAFVASGALDDACPAASAWAAHLYSGSLAAMGVGFGIFLCGLAGGRREP